MVPTFQICLLLAHSLLTPMNWRFHKKHETILKIIPRSCFEANAKIACNFQKHQRCQLKLNQIGLVRAGTMQLLTIPSATFFDLVSFVLMAKNKPKKTKSNRKARRGTKKAREPEVE